MIDEAKIFYLLEKTKYKAFSISNIQEILLKAKQNAINPISEFTQCLNLEDVATLLNTDSKNKKLMK